MHALMDRSEWRDLEDTVEAGARLGGEEAERLFASSDLNGLGVLANRAAERRVGRRGSDLLTRYLNHSESCILT